MGLLLVLCGVMGIGIGNGTRLAAWLICQSDSDSDSDMEFGYCSLWRHRH